MTDQSARLSELQSELTYLKSQADDESMQYYILRVKNLETELIKMRNQHQHCSACANRSSTSEKSVQVQNCANF